MLYIVLWLAAAVFVIAGVVGSVLPVLPGPILVFVGLVLGAWADGFTRVGMPSLIIIAALTAFGHSIDFLATAVGAKRFGASKVAALGAAVGAIVGIFFGVLGVLLGPFVGAVVAELAAKRDVVLAGRAGVGAWVGMVLGAAAKIAVMFAMLGLFVAAYLW